MTGQPGRPREPQAPGFRERRDRFSTISDVEIRRVCGPADVPGFDPARDVGEPGNPPFTRGIHPTGYRGRPWTMRMFAGFGAALERTRRERDAEAVGAALAGPRDAAARPESSATNLMPHFIRCAEAHATLGEQCAVLREVFGEYREPVAL